MDDSERRAIFHCGRELEAFIRYLQARDNTLTRAEATWLTFAVLSALPAMCSDDESVLEALDDGATQIKAARKSER